MAYTDKTFSAGAVLPAADLNVLRDNFRFLHDKGADLASSSTITPVLQYHRVTGTTTIDNVTILAAGARVDLNFASALTVKHNSGGTGNIRLNGSVDAPVTADTFLTLISDGTLWWEVSRSPSKVAATVATTVAGLGTALDGKIGKVRSGSTPFDHTTLIYDATYGKWVATQERLASLPNSAASANNNIATGAGYGGRGYEVATDTPRLVGTAGMHFQFTGLLQVQSSANDGTMFTRLRIADLYSDTAISGAGSTTARGDLHPWSDFASAGDGWMYAAGQCQKTGGTGTVALNNLAWDSIRSRLVG